MLGFLVRGIVMCSVIALAWAPQATTAQQIEDTTTAPGPIDFAMYYHSDIRDSPQCQVTVENGVTSFGAGVTNPSVTCPDAFAWYMFTQVVGAGFWENWSTDRQTWPSDPWPRCEPGVDELGCCAGITLSNDPEPVHCPVYPGTTPGVPVNHPVRPGTAHAVSLQTATKREDGTWDDVPGALKNPVIGAYQVELIYRSQPMVDYIFDNELYYVEGLQRVFETNVRSIDAYAPYQAQMPDPSQSHEVAPPIAKVGFPTTARMLKLDWLRVDLAEKLGIDPYDTEHPFIMMDFESEAGANKGSTEHFILLSMHISTRDLPNWFWTTFEHVSNQGRCDWLGCNDSFGFVTTQTIEIDAASAGGLAPPSLNYIPPHKLADVDKSDVTAFDLAQRYVGLDRMTDALDALLDAYDIGTATSPNTSGLPTPQDLAWRSYRLKGTQVDWASSDGQITHLGNSVTEAGFVNTASCITCHARAAVNAAGLPAFSIFDLTLNDVGLAQSVNGVPDPNQFASKTFYGADGQREALSVYAVQTDFVWGIRFACPINQSELGPSWCANVIGPGYSTPVPSVPPEDSDQS